MRRAVVTNLILAEANFFSFLFLAVIITTAAFQHNRGLSFYGEHWKTAVPYGAGFMVCDYFILNAASLLPRDVPSLRHLAWGLRILALLLLAVLLTPDTLNSFFNDSHEMASTVLFLFELTFAVFLARRAGMTLAAGVLMTLEATAAVLAMLSQLHVIYYLSEGILVFQLVFSTHLCYGVNRWLARLEAARVSRR